MRASLSSLFKEDSTPLSIRWWPLLLWIFVSLEAGNYLCLLAAEEYRMLTALLCAAATGALLFKPMLRLSKKKRNQ